MKLEWNRESVLLLIDLWSQNPCLYNPANKLYRNKKTRLEVLEKITNKLRATTLPKVTLDDVRIKINYLRGQYSHELGKMKKMASTCKTTGELELAYEPTAYWFDKIQFLSKYVKSRSEIVRNTKADKDLYDEIKDIIIEEEKIELQKDSDIGQEEVYEEVDISESETENHDQIIIYPDDEGPTAKRNRIEIIEESSIEQKQNINMNSTSEKELSGKFPLDIEVYGEYVKSELLKIKNEELRDEAEHEINNILFNYKKKQRNLKYST